MNKHEKIDMVAKKLWEFETNGKSYIVAPI